MTDDRSPAGRRSGPLAGVRVLDISSVVMGPYATQMLGDLGADIVTVEDRNGDHNRSMGPGPIDGLSGVALNLMRNKRSVALDLKHERGRDVALRLAARADIVVTNLRSAPLARLGLGADELRSGHPDLIVCQAHGFRSDEGRAGEPAYDDVIQSTSGISDLFARLADEPALAPTLIADKVGAYAIVTAVLAALLHRERTGEGQFVEVPMHDVMASFTLVEHGSRAIPEPPIGPPGYQRLLTAHRRPHRTADGWITVVPYTRRAFRAIFRQGGRDDLVDDPRLSSRESIITNTDSLYRDVAAIFLEHTTEECLQLCARNGIAATAPTSLDELVDGLPLAEHPHAGRYRVIPPPVIFERTPAAVDRQAPLHGADGREVLAELGYASAEIDELITVGALIVPH